MDKLPMHNELVFKRVRKELYLRLMKVIRALADKFDSGVGREPIQRLSEHLMPSLNLIHALPAYGRKVTVATRFYCVLREISDVAYGHRNFLLDLNGNKTHTRKVRAGIERLEWLVENWDDLEITGDLKSGYKLELKV